MDEGVKDLMQCIIGLTILMFGIEINNLYIWIIGLILLLTSLI